MENNNLEFLLNDNITLDLSNFVVNLFVAALLSVIIQIFYLKYSTTLSSKFEFSKNFVILGITTTIVITIIKSSLALSLGLVGALSIVRFRAAIKEPEELVFLFLIISTGLGCGAGQIKIISIGILFSLISIFLYSKFFERRYLKLADTLNLAIIADKKLSEKEVNEKMDEIRKYTSKIELISFSKSEDNTTINFDVQLNNFSDLNKLTEILQKNDTRVLFARNDLTAL
mgnify:FL=1|jgi:uncharacterized membrane protein YhiD involved in acid resistance|tara:strand:- start:413 stop:1099 length:687 start_codon:yes stop_codon:yes gene_type:complete